MPIESMTPICGALLDLATAFGAAGLGLCWEGPPSLYLLKPAASCHHVWVLSEGDKRDSEGRMPESAVCLSQPPTRI